MQKNTLTSMTKGCLGSACVRAPRTELKRHEQNMEQSGVGLSRSIMIHVRTCATQCKDYFDYLHTATLHKILMKDATRCKYKITLHKNTYGH